MPEFIGSLIRHLLTAGGTLLAGKGFIESGEVELITGAIVTIIATGWGAYQKYQAKKKLDKAIAAPAGEAE